MKDWLRVSEQVNGGTWDHYQIYTDDAGERIAVKCDEQGWISVEDLEPAIGPEGHSATVIVSRVAADGDESLGADYLIQDDGSVYWNEAAGDVVGWQPRLWPMRGGA